MKRQGIFTFILISLLTMTGHAEDIKIINRADGSITFVVDEDLTPINDRYRHKLFTGGDIADNMLNDEQISDEVLGIIATSFAMENNLYPMGKDAFYKTVVEAYANHQSLTISPDMIWLIICQGFARYVNAHTEEMRPKLVNHEGKMDLVVETKKDLLTEDVDWPSLIDNISSQIDKYTKNNVAKIVTSDFTTTGQVERVASQITLMESVKSYFEYIIYRIVCGIPSVTLQGTVSDWQRVLEKTMQLKAYGLEPWVNELEPILKEFIQAADGHPNQVFWKGIVRKQSIDKLKGGGCIPEKPTELDGWLLKLFPDENGQTLDKINHKKNMPSEYVRVRFKYRTINPENGNLISEMPMELWAGFIGAKVDTTNNILTPKIGWLVRVAEGDDYTLNKLKKNNENGRGIELRIKEVPEMLSQLGYIKSLRLVFTDKVVLPEWMDNMTIDEFIISGKMTEEEKANIRKRFHNIKIQ